MPNHEIREDFREEMIFKLTPEKGELKAEVTSEGKGKAEFISKGCSLRKWEEV